MTELAVEEQMTLVPSEPPVPSREMLKLGMLAEGLDGTPDADLVKSIELLGVIEPIIVTVRGGTYTVRAGRRRVGAARKVGLDAIPAQVYREDDWDPGILTLTENLVRSTNPIAEARVIKGLIRRGMNVEDIAHEVHVGLNTLRALLPLTALPEPFLVAVDEGKIAPGIARQIAKLSEEQQAQLLMVLETAGKITSADVHAVREVRLQQIEQDWAESFGDVNEEVPPLLWHEEVAGLVQRALAITERQDIAVRGVKPLVLALNEALDMLESIAEGVAEEVIEAPALADQADAAAIEPDLAETPF